MPKESLMEKFKPWLPSHLRTACQSQGEVGVNVGLWGDMLTQFIQKKHLNLCFLSHNCQEAVPLLWGRLYKDTDG